MTRSFLACALLVLALAWPAPAQDCTSLPLLTDVGAGTPGATGVPALDTLGQPMVNQPGMGLRITAGAPGAAAQLVVGSTGTPQFLPAYGARLYPGAPFTRFPLTIGPDGTSATVLSGPAPTSPALCGVEFVAQGVVTDPVAQGGLAFTSGLRLRFGVGSAAASLFQGAKFTLYDSTGLGLGIDLAAGDLNGDGLTDIVAPIAPNLLSGASGGIQIMLQLSDRSLWRSGFIATPGNPAALAVVDLDGDGALDLVIGVSPQDPVLDPGSLRVHLGFGDGTFEAGQIISKLGSDPRSIAATDLDGDSLPELAVHSWNAAGSCAVFPNLGSGVLGSPTELPPSGSVVSGSLRFADMDGDGRLDLVGLVQFTYLVVHAGLGGTAFGPPIYSDLGTEDCQDLDVADLDADGDSDVVVASMGFQNGSLRVYWNVGGGQLSAPTELSSTGFYFQAFAEDLDGDDLPEILSLDGFFHLLVVPNLGGGGLGPIELVKSTASRILPVDMDGDGDVDVASRRFAYASWTAGAGDGSFVLPPPLAPPLGSELVLRDVDLDGHLDLMGLLPSGALLVRLGAGDGTFGPPIDSATGGSELATLDIGRIDGDALLDAVVTAKDGAPSDWSITVMLGQGNGQFVATTPIVLSSVIDARLADLDSDGDLDVLAATFTGPGQLHSLLGAGDGTFGAPLLAASSILRFDSGDVDEDGLPDVVAFDDDHALVLRTGVGDGTFASAVVIPTSADEGAPTIRLADLDLDGHLDLVHGGSGTSTVLLHTYRGNGAGLFAPVQTTAGLAYTTPIKIADVNGDGAPDIVAGGVQLGFGDVSFAAAQPGEVSGALGDVDEDGDLDVVQSALYLNSLY